MKRILKALLKTILAIFITCFFGVLCWFIPVIFIAFMTCVLIFSIFMFFYVCGGK